MWLQNKMISFFISFILMILYLRRLRDTQPGGPLPWHMSPRVVDTDSIV